MRAFHTLRTKNAQNFRLDDFETFALILSALEWRRFNGEIFLYTDSAGKAFLDRAGILDAYTGTEISLNLMDSFALDENIFWAGAKIFALSFNPAPCVMLDLDFIVWRPINFDRFTSNLAVIHRESTSLPCYPDKNFFHFRDGFVLPDDLNWSLEPCNAALVYFGSQRFVDEYRNFAFEFMNNAAPPPNQSGWELLPYMVFVEQRWMAMCAHKSGVEIFSLSNLQELFGGQNLFTHLWGYKQFLRDNPAEAVNFCRKCAARLKHDFPDFAKKISACDWAQKYF